MAPNVFINSPDSSFSAKWCQHSVINVDKALWSAVSVQFHRTEFSDKLSPTGAPTLSSTLPNSTMDFFSLSYLTVATLESTLWPQKIHPSWGIRLRQQTWISSCLLYRKWSPSAGTENERIRLTFEKECRGHYGEKREHLAGSYCDISAWGCFSLEKALVGGGPGLTASLIYLNNKLPPVAGPSHMLCPELLAENQPFHKTKRYVFICL